MSVNHITKPGGIIERVRTNRGKGVISVLL